MSNNFFKYILNIIEKIKSSFFYNKVSLLLEKNDSSSLENYKYNNCIDYDFHDFDSLIEVDILVNLKPSVKGIDLSCHLKEFKNISDSFIRIMLENNFGKKSEILDENDYYVSIHIFVLLASRDGPIDSEQWHKIVSISRKLANNFNAMIVVPDKQIVINKAKKLDNLCAFLDAQIKFKIVTDHCFSREKLSEIISSIGFNKFHDIYILKSDRIKVYLKEDDNLCNLDIIMDIPCSIQDENTLNAFFDLSSKIAKELNAKLVDDNGLILNDDSIELISRQLNKLFKRLDECGFTSGSYRARRVFK
ncbi:barrier septum formation protein [Candidatus Kinetoplastibacterium blastocrithidii TCC012E]|uniref:Cell division protein ZipA n=1 Tax=Candidatus Kinetoplastidibacterium blastocrithidiae TCC012E TaxID=1208922 RepID=M1LWL1_9PROT|nr:cell division protein ZipA C-terminal FtsZ-binding domain-containing protein [Candidatus Kinetoplastibacterium blastocrithidii]AFZ83787.1 hypothetical protein CKBE_00598 [Candidatus Kinetoplastibacterium blastocrithidii (ex Strigomonas culicis)]AGF49912.1 barrier septum formation protein [Candidatus Kinetoplastibacterium blastocrithidii TCC012E]